MSPECLRSADEMQRPHREPRLDRLGLPLRLHRLGGSYSIASLVVLCVSPPTITPFTGAADCRRDAVFTTSPATIASPSSARALSDTSASPC
jgi:hypothetical protein